MDIQSLFCGSTVFPTSPNILLYHLPPYLMPILMLPESMNVRFWNPTFECGQAGSNCFPARLMPAKATPFMSMCVRVQTLSLEKNTFPKEFKISQNMINRHADYLKLKRFNECYNQNRLFGFSLPPYFAIIKILGRNVCYMKRARKYS